KLLAIPCMSPSPPPVRRLQPTIACPLRIPQFLEATVGHSLVVEDRLIAVHHLCDSGIWHDLLVGPVSMFPRFKHHPGEDHGFIWPRLGEVSKRDHVLRIQVVTGAFP